MKNALVFPLLSVMMACHTQEPRPVPAPVPLIDFTLVRGRIVAVQATTDAQGLHPRLRWALNLDPLTLPGWNGNPYPIAKTFSLPDTLAYKTGALVLFHYRLVPRAHETPWQTDYEWRSTQSTPPGYWKNAEITLSDIQMKKTD